MNHRFARITIASGNRTIGVGYVDLTDQPNADLAEPLKYLVQIVHEQDVTPGFTDVPLYGQAASAEQPVMAEPDPVAPSAEATGPVPFDVSPAT